MVNFNIVDFDINKKGFKLNKLILVILALSATLSFANGPERGTPPEEAITACVGQDNGAACSMSTPRGDSITGTCMNTPDKKYFACKPEGMDNNQRPHKR